MTQAENISNQLEALKKDIATKQRALQRAKRTAALAPVRQQAQDDSIKEMLHTRAAPVWLVQEIEKAYSKTVIKVLPRFGTPKPALTFIKGKYEYRVFMEVLPDINHINHLYIDILKVNRDRRFWHDSLSKNLFHVSDVMDTLRKFIKHVPETAEAKIARLWAPNDSRRLACEQLLAMKVLPVGGYINVYMSVVDFWANGKQVRLSLAKGKVRWGGIDVTEKDAKKKIRALFAVEQERVDSAKAQTA
jgi:hypothetical protein